MAQSFDTSDAPHITVARCGGSLSIVAAVGVLVFKERLSPYGYLGILTGIAGIAILATV